MHIKVDRKTDVIVICKSQTIVINYEYIKLCFCLNTKKIKSPSRRSWSVRPGKEGLCSCLCVWLVATFTGLVIGWEELGLCLVEETKWSIHGKNWRFCFEMDGLNCIWTFLSHIAVSHLNWINTIFLFNKNGLDTS